MNTQNSPAPAGSVGTRLRAAVTSAGTGVRGAAASLGTRFREALDLRPMTTTDLARIPVFAALTAVLAQASVHLFGNAVPITGQTLGVMLAGLILGPIRGGLAMAVYVVLGVAGLPIFANATGGAGIISGPTGGFILAFPIAAFAIGLLTARFRTLTPAIAFSACVTGGIALVYLIGVPWLAWRLDMTAEEAIVAGAVAFVPGDLIKAALATYIAVGVYRAYPALGGVRARTS